MPDIDTYEAKAILKETCEAIQTVQENLAYLSQILNQPTQPIQQQPTQASHNTIEEVRMLFPKDLDALLEFFDCQTYIMIQPRQWLGKEAFVKIAQTIKDVGGEYVSAGKNTHFRVYTKSRSA